MGTDYSDYYVKNYQIILIALFFKIIKKLSVFSIQYIINRIWVQYIEKFLDVILHNNCNLLPHSSGIET